MPGKESRKSSSGILGWIWIPILAAVVGYSGLLRRVDPWHHPYADLLLFTPYRDALKAYWEKNMKIDKGVKIEPSHVPTIDAKDYTYETLRVASENFRYPVIVRDFFKGTPAMEKWITEDYLPSRLGDYIIPVVNNAVVGQVQNNRSNLPFGPVFNEILSDDNSKLYLFFPVKSRFNFNGSDIGSAERLQQDVNDIVREDLELDRIWKGFGTKAHKAFRGSQLIIGKGSEDSAQTTGTGWHCAIGNNWFAQVAGTKRWYFMDQKYSALMHPLRGGKYNMMTGTTKMASFHGHIPLRYGDVRAGDLLYNPDWEWHTIQNHKGLSIGVPIREANFSLSFQNNFLFSSVALFNVLTEQVGIDIGGYAPN